MGICFGKPAYVSASQVQVNHDDERPNESVASSSGGQSAQEAGPSVQTVSPTVRGLSPGAARAAQLRGQLNNNVHAVPNPNDFVDPENELTRFHDRAGKGDIRSVKQMLNDPDLDINRRDVDEDTALHHATGFNKREMVKLLFKQEQLHPNLTNKSGETALSLATLLRHKRIAKTLKRDPRVDQSPSNAEVKRHLQQFVTPFGWGPGTVLLLG